MKALSLRQPWTWAILHAGKDVENRAWRTSYRGPVLLHASRTYDTDGEDWIEERFDIVVPAEIPLGGIVGVVTITDCVAAHPSRWFQGPYGFLLADARPLPFVPLRGHLGFFQVPGSVFDRLGGDDL